jgi:D-sedoheptulose 7-phosphate isomerase
MPMSAVSFEANDTNDAKLLQLAIDSFAQSVKVKQQVLTISASSTNHRNTSLGVLVKMAKMIAFSINNGGKLLLCGNGGSAADAQHLATELLVRLRSEVNRRSLPAIALAMDTSMLSATSNDYGFEHVFARPLSGLGRKGDVLLGITTSGKSLNVLEALKVAKQMNIITLGFLGHNGEPALSLCDEAFVVPSTVTARIQESHITAGHTLMELIEEILCLTTA